MPCATHVGNPTSMGPHPTRLQSSKYIYGIVAAGSANPGHDASTRILRSVNVATRACANASASASELPNTSCTLRVATAMDADTSADQALQASRRVW